MPLYDYECLANGHVFEVRQKVIEVGNASCPSCSSDSRRVFHSVPILFKGSGFYSTDNRKGQASSTSSNGKEESSSDSESKSESDSSSKSDSDSSSKSKSESSSSDKSSEKSADKVASKTDS